MNSYILYSVIGCITTFMVTNDPVISCLSLIVVPFFIYINPPYRSTEIDKKNVIVFCDNHVESKLVDVPIEVAPVNNSYSHTDLIQKLILCIPAELTTEMVLISIFIGTACMLGFKNEIQAVINNTWKWPKNTDNAIAVGLIFAFLVLSFMDHIVSRSM